MYHFKETLFVQPLIIEHVFYLLVQRTDISMIKYLLQIMANIFTDDTKLLSENMNTINNNTEILLQVKK